MTTVIDGAGIDVNSIPGNRLKTNAEIERTQLKQFPNSIIGIPPTAWVVWNSGQPLPSTPAADDLGIVSGTFATDVTTIQAGDLKAAGATTRYALARVALPGNYEDGQTVTLRLRCKMDTNAADTSCTIDAEVYEVSGDGLAAGTPTDLCATAAQDMNNLTAADYDFTITPDNLVAGDELEIRIAIACNDAATGTAVTPKLCKAQLLCDTRG